MKTIHNGTMEYEVAENIAVPHGFTTRFGGVSTGIFSSLNLAFHRGDREEAVRENYRRLGVALGFDPKKLVLTRQTHSDIIRVVSADDHQGLDHHVYPECDGLITNTPGTALVVFTADCTPILLHDPVTGAVGAAHAGWRGTASSIAAKTVEAMVREFGSRPGDIRAAIGPNIGQCCFETDADVPQAMIAAFGPKVDAFIRKSENKYYVNLKEINALVLRRAGVEHIDISTDCTACQNERFWSHRITGGLRGSQGAVIICERGRI